jgi:hypothetical protein
MKKMLWVVLVLLLSVPKITLASTPAKNTTPPDWVVEHQKQSGKGRLQKHTKPPRKIAGTVNKNAKQVSPKPKEKKK